MQAKQNTHAQNCLPSSLKGKVTAQSLSEEEDELDEAAETPDTWVSLCTSSAFVMKCSPFAGTLTDGVPHLKVLKPNNVGEKFE